ncbi:MAG: type I methionyl aminopeptidase [Cytophagales bacterium]
MSITSVSELAGMRKVSEAVAVTLKKMREYAKPGISTKALDEYGAEILKQFEANSAPKLTYNFPASTCICTNMEIAHGLPSEKKILSEGDLINIDVSAELDGFWADNGGSFVLGNDIFKHQKLVDASRNILFKAIQNIRGGVKIADIGRLIENEAKSRGYKVIRNLVGHGVGKSLHEEPTEIPCFYDKENTSRFRKGSLIAVETFISTGASKAVESSDGWTLVSDGKTFVAQHEHTLMVTESKPIILTEMNGIWD